MIKRLRAKMDNSSILKELPKGTVSLDFLRSLQGIEDSRAIYYLLFTFSYLHIGHIKALLLNYTFAQKYKVRVKVNFISETRDFRLSTFVRVCFFRALLFFDLTTLTQQMRKKSLCRIFSKISQLLGLNTIN